MGTQLMKGGSAIAASAISAGCRFFAGYPMEPFTALLEGFSVQMPGAGGTCINAESEIEGINMALGASAAGARAATGSCGQGLALMQEAIAEAALNELPLVVFNLARGQQDYFQATRGGGWGDYRTIALAPKDAAEAVEHTQLLFHLADLYRTPVLLYGDYLVSGTYMSVDTSARHYGELPEKDWALDGSRGGTRRSRVIWTWRRGKTWDPGPGPDKHWQAVADKYVRIAATEARHESSRTEDADTVVVAFGTTAPFVEYVVEELRGDGVRIGWFRPVSLWPFPELALAEATESARRVLVYELNAGQMIDDVRLSVTDRTKVVPIGRVSQDESGLKQGELLAVDAVRERIVGHLDPRRPAPGARSGRAGQRGA